MSKKELYEKECLDFEECEDCPLNNIEILCRMLLTNDDKTLGDILEEFEEVKKKVEKLGEL